MSTSKSLPTLFLGASAMLFAGAGLQIVFDGGKQVFLLAAWVVGGMGCLAIAANLHAKFRGFAFSLWVMTLVAAAMFHPELFQAWNTKWGTFEQKNLIVPLIQIIMFGMGATLCIADFTRVLAVPRAVGIGVLLQFTIMPLTGAGLAMLFGFPPEVAAGVVLIGSCPGGVASNVMAYLSRGDVALSVTMTACSTLVSPVLTPLAMKLLAGQYIEIEFVTMLVAILKMIIAPIVFGLIANRLLTDYSLLGPKMERTLSVIAMVSICYIIAIITSLSRDQLMTVGLSLIVVAVAHNAIGYLLGYWCAYFTGLDETTRRTVAIEVGLQNGGMASGLAVNVLKSSNAALASAIFGPWMNISGSILASWWRGRSVKDNHSSDAENG
ncbi:MAG: bile acid:sodium symporter family protein [Fuerstiella sp.]|nr:bile acid:sodium symporter family protein [Fuerstiella sp.]